MINADEHKKLLAQITELEKKSVNYFDVEKEFFLIDSDNLSQVRPRLYGYSIQRNGIYEDDNLTPEAIAGLDGRGCYVYVDVQDGKITIKQDLNGCWGIYLFRHGDYFALSNSFFRLLDHIKFKYPLTVNRDYCYYRLIYSYASYAYSETTVNEIQLVDRNATIIINIEEKNLQVNIIDFKEHIFSLDSEEGIAALDRWFEFWCNVLCCVAQHTNFILADLSGGFDSRISFIPLLNSGIDLNKMRINSIKSTSHTLKEDYEIASKIAEHYGFKLNNPLPMRKYLNYSLADVWNIDLYGNQTFSSMPRFRLSKNVDKLYQLSGLGGEGIRATFGESPNKFIEAQNTKINSFSNALSKNFSRSIENILKSGFLSIKNKCKIEDQNSKDITLYLPRDTLDRHHCGKEILINYLCGKFIFSPIFDPDLYSLKLNTSKCPDSKLLIAMIFSRYEPNLLEFPFDSKHTIALETIEYAKKINERFPLVKKDKTSISGGGFHLKPRDTQTEKILSLGRNNPVIPGGLPEACLKAIFESSKTYGFFNVHFDDERYYYAANYYDTHVFARNRPMYTIVGVTKVLEDVEISQRNYPQYQNMKRFLEQDFAIIYNDAQVINKFHRFFTARVNIKLLSTTGDLQLFSVSDDRATVLKPAWYQKNGIGYQIHSYFGKLEFVAKATVEGKFVLALLGLDVHTPEDNSKRIPYWIDYTKLIVNGKLIFDKLTPTWHDKYYVYNMDVKANEEVKIQVEWLPHIDNAIGEVVAPTPKPAVAPTPKPAVAPTSKPAVAPTPKPAVALTPKPEVAPTLKPAVALTPKSAVSKEVDMRIFTSRMDIQLIPQMAGGDFKILSVSDKKATVWKPDWFQIDGIGYQIQSYAGNMNIIAKATADGQIRLNLRGLDVRDPKDKSKRIPYWIDYTKLTVNGKVIINKRTPAWHDKAYYHAIDVKANEEIKVQVEWLPHRSDTGT